MVFDALRDYGRKVLDSGLSDLFNGKLSSFFTKSNDTAILKHDDTIEAKVGGVRISELVRSSRNGGSSYVIGDPLDGYNADGVLWNARLSLVSGETLRKNALTLAQKYILNDNKNYGEGELEELANYIDSLPKFIGEFDADKKSFEMAKTLKVLALHKRDYIKNGFKVSFQDYLFGENGILTEQRLKDMKKVKNQVKKLGLKPGESYNFVKRDEKGNVYDTLTVKFGKPKGRNDNAYKIHFDDSVGMKTKYGVVDFDELSEMFGRKYGSHFVKRSISNSINNRLNNARKYSLVA